MTEPILAVDGLVKHFGGLTATDDLSLTVTAGEIHAIIGPNGAGKTTLIAQLSGELAPDDGRIRFDGQDITALRADERSHLGLARSFQITSIFPAFSALDNVALAVQAHAGHSFRFWSPARRETTLREPALAALDGVGLADRADHGGQSEPRRAAAVGDRHGAGDQTQAAVAGRTDGRHGRGRVGPHDRPA